MANSLITQPDDCDVKDYKPKRSPAFAYGIFAGRHSLEYFCLADYHVFNRGFTMIIDCHVHLLPRPVREDRTRFCQRDAGFACVYTAEKAKIASEAEILEYLDVSQIDRAVVFGFPWLDQELARGNNDAVWSFYQRYPDRIVPFAVLPACGGDKAHMEAERTLSAGFAGIGELAPYHLGWNRETLKELGPSLELAGACEVPVLIHVNEPVGHDYPGKIPVDFRAMVEVIKEHAGVDFILAHFGGGLFIYALMPEVRGVLTRTYVDTAASPFLYDQRIFDVARRVLGKEKILFGSDFPLLPLSRYMKDLDLAGISDEQRAAILGGNAAELFAKKRSSCATP